MTGSIGDISGSYASPEAFVGLSDCVQSSGVASLDSPLIQQTKSEIRSLAAEIAQLAHTGLEPDEFYEGFLPRLCLAMGAKGAGVWSFNSDSSIRLVASHLLPSEIYNDWQPTVSHRRILECVAAEGQPILVPPGNVRVDADRPSNPLADSLIVVPVRIQDDVAYLLEVVQRPSGGPAAQRGYLRFVAQMSDLMADYLRRQQLRALTGQQQRLQRIEEWLTALADSSKTDTRRRLAADALLDLFHGDRVLLLHTRRRPKVIAVSGARVFDSRSEIVIGAQSLRRSLAELSNPSPINPISFEATDRRQDMASPPTGLQAQVDSLCQSLGCRRLLHLPLDALAQTSALVAYGEASPSSRLAMGLEDESASKLALSIGTLVAAAGASPFWSQWTSAWANPVVVGKVQRKRTLQLWLSRMALVALVSVLGVFPVPQRISATALLQPLSKQMYYAPASGIVSEVYVDEGSQVTANQQLLRITSHELDATAENLKIELKKTEDQLEEKSSLFNRGEYLSPVEKDQLEYDLRELQTSAASARLQLSHTVDRLRELTVSARQPGTVSTWSLKNRLLHHPVQSGELLATTFEPAGKWRLQLSIPDYRAGLVSDAMANADSGAVRVEFSLASHPDQLLEAFAVDMSSQVTMQAGDAGSKSARIVKTEAMIRDATRLPLKKDGAIARATIDCGRVPLCWLVFRDAYWALSSRAQQLW